MAKTLKSAQDKLEEIENSRPEAYSSAYRDEMSSLSDRLKNRKFSWDQSSDPFYKQYADRYIQQGKLAMNDSMGKSAALTGGYGNTYGSGVAQQTYDSYLQALADAGLDIYDRAYTRYNDAGDALSDEYSRLKDLDDADYTRWSDALKAWMDDRDYYADLEDTLYQRALAAASAAATSSGGGGGSGSGKTKANGSSSGTNRYDAVLAQVRALDAGGSSTNTIQGKINTAYNAGSITEAQKNWLTNNFGSGSTTSSNVKKPGTGLRLA